MKNLIKKVVLRLWPELDSGTHLPRLAVVVHIPDPPAAGGVCTPERPRYAVDVRMLTPDMVMDEAMPLLRDVPVAMTGSADHRGFAALPQPGTIVEIAFAFGRQSLPFVRSVLPDHLALPAIDARSQKWQQTAGTFQEVDAVGNWLRLAEEDIIDVAAGDIESSAGGDMVLTASKLWVGSGSDNFLQIVADFMVSTRAALATLAAHTHNGGSAPDQGGSVAGNTTEITAQQARLDVIKK